MMKCRIVPAALFMLMALTACTEELEFSSSFEKKVTVNCLLGDSDVQTMTLTWNTVKGVFKYEYVEDADAMLFLDGKEVGRFSYEGKGIWSIEHHPVAGGTYRLEISVPGEKLINATTTMPAKADVKRKRFDYKSETVKYFTEESRNGVFWVFVMKRNPLEMIDPDKEPEILDSDILATVIGTDHRSVDNFNVSDQKIFTDFGTPGISLEHPAYLRISEPEDQAPYPYEFFIESELDNSTVVFRTVSDEYDKYLKTSLLKAMAYESEDDITSYFEENRIYSNIRNGIGIFGACSDLLIPRNFIIDHI